MRRRRAGLPLGLRAAVAAAALAALTIGYTATAGNTLPTSNATSQSFAITAQSLAPPECSGLSLTSAVTASGAGSGNELVIGTSGTDSVFDHTGGDCIVLGTGYDSVNLKGTNVCIVNASVNASKCTTVVIRP